MKIQSILFCVILILLTQLAMAESCYLLVEKTGKFERTTIFELTSTLLAQFVEPVEEFPSGGVSKKDCLYKISVLQDSESLSIAISGRHVAGLGQADKKGLSGLQQSILRALWGADAEIQSEMCIGYQSLLNKECEKLLDVASSEAIESDSTPGFWFVEYEEDDATTYLKFKENKTIGVCSNEKNEYYFEELVIKDQMVEWEQDEYEIEVEDDILLLKGEDTLEFEYKESVSEICRFYLTDESYAETDYDLLEGVWYTEFEDDDEALYIVFNHSGDAEICELKTGEVVDQFSGVAEDDTFIWDDDPPVPMLLSSDYLMIKGEDYTVMLSKTSKTPEVCRE